MIPVLLDFVLEGALSSAPDSDIDAGAAEAAKAQAAAAQQQVLALQEVVRQQQKLQDERESNFVSQLLDRPASGILGGSQDLGILEAARAEAGSPFDGNDPHSAWMILHDPWFSPDTTGLRPGSNPLPVGEGPVAVDLRPIDCGLGKLCAFPPGSARVTIVKTASTGASSQPGASGSTSSALGVATEWRQVGNQVVWAAALQDFTDAMETASQPEITAEILASGAFNSTINWADESALSGTGIQQMVAGRGRDIYQRIMEKLLAEIRGLLSNVVSGHDREALERSNTLVYRVRESILSDYKMIKIVRLLQSGDAEGAGQVAGDEISEKITEYMKERAKEFYLDIIPASDSVKEVISKSADLLDQYLQLRAK
jgi:hypothetical protein